MRARTASSRCSWTRERRRKSRMSARGIAAQVQRCRTACSAEIAAALFGFHLASERFGDEHSGRTFAEVGCEPLLRLGIGARAVEGHLSEMKRGRCGAVSARKSLAKRAVCRGGAFGVAGEPSQRSELEQLGRRKRSAHRVEVGTLRGRERALVVALPREHEKGCGPL